MKKANVFTAPTNQQPEQLAYARNRHGWTLECAELSVGGGASLCHVNDVYPYTIWGWEVSKSGKITIYVTPDEVRFEKAADWTPANGNGQYVFTSNPPSVENPAEAVELSKKGCLFMANGRAYYQNPSI